MKFIMKSKRLQVGILVFIAVLLCSAAVYIWVQYSQPKTITLSGEAQVLRERATDIEANIPAVNAPLSEKLAYYDQLTQARRVSGDHKGAVMAFESRSKLSEAGLTYRDYLLIASSYQVLSQKEAALGALAQSEKLLPPDAPDEGFFRSEVLDDINKMRSELQ